jgi:hypothetical protein
VVAQPCPTVGSIRIVSVFLNYDVWLLRSASFGLSPFWIEAALFSHSLALARPRLPCWFLKMCSLCRLNGRMPLQIFQCRDCARNFWGRMQHDTFVRSRFFMPAFMRVSTEVARCAMIKMMVGRERLADQRIVSDSLASGCYQGLSLQTEADAATKPGHQMRHARESNAGCLQAILQAAGKGRATQGVPTLGVGSFSHADGRTR